MKTKIILILSFALLILSVTFVSAEFWACSEKGEVIDYCNPKTPDRTCSLNNGCEYCMKNYNETNECYNQGNWGICMNNIDRVCSTFGGTPIIDVTPPEFTLISPVQDIIYTSRSTLIEFNLNEKASVYYKDNLDDRDKWVRICSDCSAGTPSYSRQKSFNEGFNNVSFRAVDVVGNEVIVNRTFFIDTKKPKIHRTLPRSEYASGLFEVEYSEDNLDKIEITFGNEETRFETIELSGCESGEKVWCNIKLNLADFNNQKIEYLFNITDKAGNSKTSQTRKNLNVDTVFPILNNPDSFYEQGEGKYSRYVYFEMDISEENLDEVVYSYIDGRGQLNKERLCSRLKDGICKARKLFREGDRIVDVVIIDEAGNFVVQEINYIVEY